MRSICILAKAMSDGDVLSDQELKALSAAAIAAAKALSPFGDFVEPTRLWLAQMWSSADGYLANRSIEAASGNRPL